MAVIEDVDIVVDYHHALHIEIGAQNGQDGIFRLTGNPLFDGNVTGKRRRHPHGFHGGNHSANGAVEVGLNRRGREHQVIQVAHCNVLEDRIAAMGDRADLHHLALALAETVTGELAEGTFRRAFVG